MNLKKNKKENNLLETNLEEEYDEDLEELLEEETPIISREEIEKELENSKILVNLDKEIEDNIASYLVYGDIVKWLMLILAVISFIIGLASGEGILAWIIISISFVFFGLLSAMIIKWFGYVLKCLYDIKMK